MKTIINFKEKLRWIINSFFFPFLRFFFFLLILIWTFKSYETYYYYENIAIAKKHEEIECGKEKKTLSDLGEELLEKIRKNDGNNKKDFPKFKILNEKLEDLKGSNKEKKYKEKLEDLKQEIIREIRTEESKNKEIIEINSFSFKDPIKFIFIDSVNLFLIKKIRENLKINNFYFEVILKIFLIRSFFSLLTVTTKNLDKFTLITGKIKSPFYSIKEKEKMTKEIIILLLNLSLDFFNRIFLSYIIISHPFFLNRLDKEYLIMLEPKFSRLIFFFFILIIMRMIRNFIMKKEKVGDKNDFSKTFTPQYSDTFLLTQDVVFFFWNLKKQHNIFFFLCNDLTDMLVMYIFYKK